ncbi:MAG: outer membrane protein assembly factor BamE [Pseudomonadota bacterium]
MPELLRRYAFAAASFVAAGVLLPGCGTVDGASNGIISAITPYRIEVVQGNFVSKEQVAALQPGMSRLQVKEVLGTPLLASIFRGNRWDYVFTIKRPGIEAQPRRLSVFFKDDVLDRFEGDEMPSEADFVASLDTRHKATGKVPRLEATEESLKKFPARPAPAAPDATAAAPAAPVAYPPLEGPASR